MRGNQVTDLSPLVANVSLGHGTSIAIAGNPIDCTAQAQNIAALRERGVTLTTDACITQALSGPAAFCNPDTYQSNFGAWPQAVGAQYCGQ